MLTDRHRITLEKAVELTARWRKNHPRDIKGVRFDRIAFDSILAQEEAAGIRIYLAEKADGSWTFVMVGTNAEGKDMVLPTSNRSNAGDDEDPDPPIEDEGDLCPSICDCESPLNGECE